MPKNIPIGLKKEIEAKANGCCEYCMAQVKYSQDYFTIEHIIPLSKKGTNAKDNLAFACQACNNHKYIATESVDPITGQFVHLYNPRKDEWKLHFQWDENFTNILGLTPVGRATVERLKLNRKGLVNLREVLLHAKKHPPLHSI